MDDAAFLNDIAAFLNDIKPLLDPTFTYHAEEAKEIIVNKLIAKIP